VGRQSAVDTHCILIVVWSAPYSSSTDGLVFCRPHWSSSSQDTPDSWL